MDKDKQKEPKTMFGVDTDFYFKWTGGKEFVTTDKTTGIPYFDYKKVWAWIEAYKNEEVKRALELGFEYGADWQEVGLPSKTQALESAFENYLNSNKD